MADDSWDIASLVRILNTIVRFYGIRLRLLLRNEKLLRQMIIERTPLAIDKYTFHGYRTPELAEKIERDLRKNIQVEEKLLHTLEAEGTFWQYGRHSFESLDRVYKQVMMFASYFKKNPFPSGTIEGEKITSFNPIAFVPMLEEIAEFISKLTMQVHLIRIRIEEEKNFLNSHSQYEFESFYESWEEEIASENAYIEQFIKIWAANKEAALKYRQLTSRKVLRIFPISIIAQCIDFMMSCTPLFRTQLIQNARIENLLSQAERVFRI